MSHSIRYMGFGGRNIHCGGQSLVQRSSERPSGCGEHRCFIASDAAIEARCLVPLPLVGSLAGRANAGFVALLLVLSCLSVCCYHCPNLLDVVVSCCHALPIAIVVDLALLGAIRFSF
jgi:hypothetical protein